MSEIQRWVPSEGMDSLSLFPDLSGPGQTEYVVYSDHLRAVTLAKIGALESITYLFKHSDGIEELEDKIAALRKELER